MQRSDFGQFIGFAAVLRFQWTAFRIYHSPPEYTTFPLRGAGRQPHIPYCVSSPYYLPPRRLGRRT